MLNYSKLLEDFKYFSESGPAIQREKEKDQI